jgi:hypothetical protein
MIPFVFGRLRDAAIPPDGLTAPVRRTVCVTPGFGENKNFRVAPRAALAANGGEGENGAEPVATGLLDRVGLGDCERVVVGVCDFVGVGECDRVGCGVRETVGVASGERDTVGQGERDRDGQGVLAGVIGGVLAGVGFGRQAYTRE